MQGDQNVLNDFMMLLELLKYILSDTLFLKYNMY